MIARTDCPDRDDLERLLFGAMPDLEMDVLEGHVAQCPDCLRVIRTLEPDDALVATVRAGGRIGSIPRDEVDKDLIGRLCRLVPSVATGPPSDATTAPDRAAAPATAEGLADWLEPPAEPDELGRIGPYGILRVLGSGGVGIVFAARQGRPRRVVALKMILSDPRSGRQRLERFRNESDILARLRHPNIVQVHEVGEHRGRPFFTMEYVEGGSLAAKLAGAPLPARTAAELTQALAQTVQNAHAHDIVHRDLKPSNVLLAADGTPRIADFGLAKTLSDDADARGVERTATGVILGTPGYMAPEQAAGEHQGTGPPADVYALGAILYECLTGRPPFRGETPLDTLDMVRSTAPVRPSVLNPRVDHDLETICLKCLEKEPKSRYRTAEELAKDLERYLAGKPILARPLGPVVKGWRWARRRPAGAALVVLILVSIVALFAGIVWHNRTLRAAADRERRQAQEALRQEGIADRERDSAEAQKRLSGEALDVVTQVVVSLANLPFTPERAKEAEDQYRGAIDLCERLLVLSPHDPSYESVLARLSLGLANLLNATGRIKDAELAYRRAVSIVERLAKDFPKNTGHRLFHAQSVNELGLLLLTTARRSEAKQAFARALGTAEELAEVFPRGREIRDIQAKILHNLAVIYQEDGRLQESELAYRRAIELHEELAAEFLDAPYRHALALDTGAIAGLLLETRQPRPQEAEQALRRALDVEDKLAAEFRSVLEYRVRAADLRNNLGILLKTIGRRGEAEAVFRQALSEFEGLASQYNLPGYRFRSGTAAMNLAESLRDQGKLDEARVLAEQAVAHHLAALKLSPGHPVYLGVLRGDYELLVEILIPLGKQAEVAKAADKAIAALADQWQSYHHIARLWARFIPTLQKESKLSDPERKDLARSYADRAVEMLRQAVERGLRQAIELGQCDVKMLEDDKDFDTIREREDFKRLVGELKIRSK